jgi:hypothetical protein
MDNDLYTRQMRDRYLRRFYRAIAYKRQFAFLDGTTRTARAVQKSLHFDTLVNTGPNSSLGYEEKIRRERRPDFLVETLQSTVTNAPGWILTSAADKLLYALPLEDEDGLDVYIMEMAELQDWFAEHQEKYTPRYSRSANRSEFYTVPMEHIFRDLEVQRFEITDTDCVSVDL